MTEISIEFEVICTCGKVLGTKMTVSRRSTPILEVDFCEHCKTEEYNAGYSACLEDNCY